MDNRLSNADVAQLREAASPEARRDSITKIARAFDQGALTGNERSIAEDIFRVAAQDVEVQVRQALSTYLKSCADLPHDVALSLSRDVEEVAVPVLEFSDVLTDADLMAVVDRQNAATQSAIARRAQVSGVVSDALVEKGDESVVSALVENEGAEIGDATFDKVMDRFGDSEAVQAPLMGRRDLPIAAAERLVTLVSDRLRDQLIAHHRISPSVVEDAVLHSRERATLGLLPDGAARMDVDELVRHLAANDRLTPTIVLRALFLGDLRFFESAVAARAQVPLINARKLIHDVGALGLDAVYARADLPPALKPAVRIALDVAAETDYDGNAHDRERYTRRMIERILTQCEEVGADNLDYLLRKLGELSDIAA